jgi:O-antigen ligase
VSSRVGNTENISTRFATYEQGLQIFEGHALFGVGATRYNDVAAALPSVYSGGAKSEPFPHSSFFLVMAEDGVAGLIALLIACAGVWGLVHALNRASYSRPDAVLAAALAGTGAVYLIYSLSLTMLPYSPPNEMIAILLGLAAGRLDFLRRRDPPPVRAAPVTPPAPRLVTASS